MKAGFRTDIAILRLLAITIVVAFHAYGMCYADSHLPSPLPLIYKDTYEWFNQYVPINVAMPLFMFISGYLFGIKLFKRTYSTLWQLIKVKFYRLLVPYYFFLPIMMATYSGFSIEPYYTGDYWHMWFLPAIFWPFVLTYLLQSLIFSNKVWVIILFFWGGIALYLSELSLPQFLGLQKINDVFYYFALGVWLYSHEDNAELLIRRNYLVYPLIFIYLTTIIFYPTEYGDRTIASIIGSSSAIITLWFLFRQISWKKYCITPFLLKLSAYSFGIYVFHNWIEVYLVSSTAKRMFPIIVDFAEHHLILFPLIFTVVAFVMSLGLTKLMLTTKLGRNLIG